MWLYIPALDPVLSSPPTAPAARASIEPGDWRSQVLSQACTWRGKPSPPHAWSRRCAKASWLQLLYGAMCTPSQAAAYADAWMGSSAVSPASRIASLASGSAATIPETFGSRPGAPWCSPEPGSSASRTSTASSRAAGQSASVESFTAWVSRLRQASSSRRRLARLKNASGSSVSESTTPLSHGAWPTATANMVTGAGTEGRDGGLNLQTAALMWATPRATPRATDGEKGGPNQSFTDGGGMPLMAQVAKWSTPRVSTGTYTRDRGKRGAERLTLEGEAKWSTPSVADVTGGRASRSGARKSERLLNGQAPDLCSRLVQETGTHGSGSPETRLNAFRRYRATIDSALRSERRALLLMAIRRRDQAKPGEVRRLQRGWTRTGLTAFVRPSFRRSLNPRFVGDLMGWPPGLTSFACSETAWSNWRARMRSELSRMSLHRAPPEQLTLFG